MSFHFDRNNSFCISLYSQPDRWNKMENRFKQFNLDVTRFKAVSELDEIDIPFASHLSPTQKYCAQSHVNLWRHVIDKNIPYILIIEDDACFDIKWKEKLDLFSTQINDPDLDAIFLNSSEPLELTDIWTIADEQYLTGGYVLTNKGAKLLLESFSKCYFTSDWMTSRLQKNRHSYTYFPWLIIQEGNETTIGSCVVEDHKKVIRCLDNIEYDMSNYII
jgi:GR25 family glycosyltransferase involved in LPS biosynthesis